MSDHYGIPIIEDDPYGQLRYEGEHIKPLVVLDAECLECEHNGKYTGNVIYLSTFSKTLAPGLRMAWIVAPKDVINRLVQAKQGTDLQCSTFDQMVTYEVGRGGFIDRHVHRIREVYGHRRNVMLAALEKAFPDPSLGVQWTRPQGGLFLWATMPDWMDTADLLKDAVKEKVAFVPGVAVLPGRRRPQHDAAQLQQRARRADRGRASRGSARVVDAAGRGAQGTMSAMKSRVAVLRVEPSTVLESTERLCELAGMRQALAPAAPTILKDNISWHFPFPGANTTPWQLEGTIRALAGRGLSAT